VSEKREGLPPVLTTLDDGPVDDNEPPRRIMATIHPKEEGITLGLTKGGFLVLDDPMWDPVLSEIQRKDHKDWFDKVSKKLEKSRELQETPIGCCPFHATGGSDLQECHAEPYREPDLDF
jgi:hypothetical protein